ncbi:unnamed protein product, partial [Didymodactylos carnosus]
YMALFQVITTLLLPIRSSCTPVLWESEKSVNFWYDHALSQLDKTLAKQVNTNLAKNIILFLGDGMGLASVTAGRIRKGQRFGRMGENEQLHFEQFPYTGFVKTYNIDYQTPDSAGTGTAYLCGVKARFNTIGLDGHVQTSNCTSSFGHNISCLTDWAYSAGKSVGIVTNSHITDASPTAAYGHVSTRFWQTYNPHNFRGYGAKQFREGCKDIARQLIEDNSHFHVLLGGGRQKFLPNTTKDGERLDNLNLIDKWLQLKNESKQSHKYVQTRKQLLELNPDKVDYVLGLFAPEYMHVDSEKRKYPDEPTLEEMTNVAIKILSKNPRGYFLFVEGGLIDVMHHKTFARLAIEEVVDFDRTIEQATKQSNENETLIIVTADHSHTFSFGGYGYRGSDIFGYASYYEGMNRSDIDNKTFSIISYGNGPNYANRSSMNSIHLPRFEYPAATPLRQGSHGGEDIPVYAQGSWSHLFQGTMEQVMIAHYAAYAACIGPLFDRQHSVCLRRHHQTESKYGHDRSVVLLILTSFILVLIILILIILIYHLFYRQKTSTITIQPQN